MAMGGQLGSIIQMLVMMLHGGEMITYVDTNITRLT